MGNLASTYQNQGRWKEAEELEVQVMETCVRVLGQEHPNTLTSIYNLALTYKSQGRLLSAILLLKKATNTQARIIGSQHPNTVLSAEVLKEWESDL